jgi:hypothetical protein
MIYQISNPGGWEMVFTFYLLLSEWKSPSNTILVHFRWSNKNRRPNGTLNKVRSKVKLTHGGAWVERRYSSYSFLNSALDGGEWSASRPGRALPQGKDPGTLWIGGWVGLEPVWKQKTEEKFFPPPGIELRSSDTILTEPPRFTRLIKY